VAVSSWFIETTLAGWVLAFTSVCLETRLLGPNSGFYVRWSLMIPQAPGKSMRAGLGISGQRDMELQARL